MEEETEEEKSKRLDYEIIKLSSIISYLREQLEDSVSKQTYLLALQRERMKNVN